MEYLYVIVGLFLTSSLFRQTPKIQFLKFVQCYQDVEECPIWDISNTRVGRF
jgi:hypothetical protein